MREKKASKLTPEQQKIISIIVTVLQVVVVILAITLSAIVLANPNINNNEVGSGSVKLLPVLTDSMKGPDGFEAGDLVIAGDPKNYDVNNLEVGTVITFVTTINGVDRLNTHRIIKSEIVDATGERAYYTQGDAITSQDPGFVLASDVLAVYKFHLKGIGKAIAWLQEPTHFLLVIVLPLIALFIYNIIILIRMIMTAKMAKVEEEKEKLIAEKESLSLDEEEIKRRAIEEFLKSRDAAPETDPAPGIDPAPEIDVATDTDPE
ncbi:MAG: hypothetical protein LBT55_07915 [Clostridiaceae bacterium]|jgi:signal peptidase|nr:hypothetical protein [Clostridiaceae bacterium]